MKYWMSVLQWKDGFFVRENQVEVLSSLLESQSKVVEILDLSNVQKYNKTCGSNLI